MPLRKLVGVLLLSVGGVAWSQVVSAPVVEPAPPPVVAGGQATALAESTVSLQVTSNLTVFYGEAVDGLAQVTASDGSTVTGTVTFYDGTAAFCTLALKDGARCPESASTGFSAGTHVLTASYSGDSTHAAATSNAVTVVVKQDVTSTALASSTNPVSAGGNVVFAAMVQGQHGTVAGEVRFRDGDTVMGTAALDSGGRAALSVLMMAPGEHAITAVYVGSENSAGSTSDVVSQVVAAPLAGSTTVLSAGAASLTVGQSASFVAQVATAGHIATGTVTFVDGGTVLGTVALDGWGRAIWLTSALSAGEHSIVARYSGDDATAASVSQAIVVMVKNGSGSTDGGLRLGLDNVSVSTGGTAVIPVMTISGSSVAAKALTVACSGLPDEATCSYVAGTVRIQTAGPRDCGTTTPYGVARLPLAGPVLAGLLVMLAPQRRIRRKGLLMAVCVAMALGSLSGCGTGNCTDLGSRPGTYNVGVSLSEMSGVQKVVLKVTP